MARAGIDGIFAATAAYLRQMTRSRRDFFIVILFAAISGAIFALKPVHIDEPYFLAVARQTLKDPFHPTDFLFNAHGRTEPMSDLHNNPPLMPAALALGMALVGERPWALRLLFLIFDVAGAAALYGIASLFLKRPLWPTLLVLSGPAYFITLQSLMGEKLAVPLALCGLYFAARGAGERKAWVLSSGLCFAAALLSKYDAVWLWLVVVAYSALRGAKARELAGFTALALGPCAFYAAVHLFGRPSGSDPVLGTLAAASAAAWSAPSGRLRALGAFVGGCSATSVWLGIILPGLHGSRRVGLWLLTAALILFGPWFDVEPVLLIDRIVGIAFFVAAGLAVFALYELPARGKRFWAIWLIGGLCATILYWSIAARVVVFAVIPLTLGLAAALEARGTRTARLYPVAFALLAVLTGALSCVDLRYALVQKDFAEQSAREPRAGALWFAGHWGLQYYLERAGARPIDDATGGWDSVRPGDRVIVPRANTNILRPRRPILADVRTVTVAETIPLRLISGWSGQGAFYSSAFGFLPYSISGEPLDEFQIVDKRP